MSCWIKILATPAAVMFAAYQARIGLREHGQGIESGLRQLGEGHEQAGQRVKEGFLRPYECRRLWQGLAGQRHGPPWQVAREDAADHCQRVPEVNLL